MELLTAEDIIEINKKIGEKGVVINEGNLDFTVQKVNKNKESLIKKAALLLYDLINSHVFLDGNKRTAFVSMETLLKANGKKLNMSDKDAIELVYKIANGKYNISDLEDIISKCIE